HGPHATEGFAGDDRVTDGQRAALHQHRRYRTPTAVEVCLDRDTTRVLVGHGPQVESRVRGEQDRLEQLVDVDALASGYLDEDRLAAVLLGHQVVLGQLLLDLVRVGAFLVDLVDRHHDRHVRR